VGRLIGSEAQIRFVSLLLNCLRKELDVKQQVQVDSVVGHLMVSQLVPVQVLLVVIVTVLEPLIWMMDQQRRETEIAAAAAAVHAALQGRCVALSAGSKVAKMPTQLRVARLAVPVPQH
jgi:hypothetical protein